jgi:hypothetical protein
MSLDVFEHRVQWELATLLVAMVLVPGAVDGASGPITRPGSDTAAAPVRRGGRGQPVRPPRSC